MFCPKCGKELADDSRFCDGCGTAQQAAAPQPKAVKTKKKKKFPVWIIIAVAAVLVVGIGLAIVLPILFPGTVTVYVLTSVTETKQDGTKITTIYSYDEFGNPLTWTGRSGLDTYRAEYDSFGNMTAQYYVYDDGEYQISNYEYSYNDNQQIESCTESSLGKQNTVWDFQWDDEGRLIRVERQEEKYVGANQISWHELRYDQSGRLVEEYFCYAQWEVELRGSKAPDYYMVHWFSYEYDADGNLTEIQLTYSTRQADNCKDEDPEDLGYSEDYAYKYEYTYDDNGRIASQIIYRSGKKRDESVYQYDHDGNLKELGRYSYEYDSYGNPVSDGQGREYTYEAVEMSPEAAQRYNIWKNYTIQYGCCNHYDVRLGFLRYDSIFYNYLIPNPVL